MARVNVGIIGAGALGLTAGLRLAQAGDTVTIFEQGSEPGGLAAAFKVSEHGTLDKFYHHIFRTDTTIIALAKELGLDTEIVWKNPNTSNLNNDTFYRFDGVIPVLQFKPIPFVDRVRVGATVALLKAIPDGQMLKGATVAGWLPRFMGKKGYNAIFGALMRGKFGDKAGEVGMPWFWARVHDRTADLGYMRQSFDRLYQRMVEKIEQHGGTLMLNCGVAAVRAEADGRVTIVRDDGQSQTFDKVLATTPTRLFTKLVEGLPDDYKTRYESGNGVEHYGAHVLILALKQKVLAEVYWLNVNDPGYPFLIACQHTNLMPASDYDGLHPLYLGNYLPMDHPLFGKDKDTVIADYLPHIKKLNPRFDASWIADSFMFKAPYAQPIMTRDYPTKLPPHTTPIPNLFLANMAHVYPHDRGQNYSIALGEKMATLLHGGQG